MKLYKKEMGDCVVFSEKDWKIRRKKEESFYKMNASYIIEKNPPRLSYPDDLLPNIEFKDYTEIVEYVEGIIALGEL